jgi:alpha-L-fucosidase 2
MKGVIDLLPALPSEWTSGEFKGVCARGAFELDFTWKDGKMIAAWMFLSKEGQVCRIKPGLKVRLNPAGKNIRFKEMQDGSIEFATTKERDISPDNSDGIIRKAFFKVY